MRLTLVARYRKDFLSASEPSLESIAGQLAKLDRFSGMLEGLGCLLGNGSIFGLSPMVRSRGPMRSNSLVASDEAACCLVETWGFWW